MPLGLVIKIYLITNRYLLSRLQPAPLLRIFQRLFRWQHNHRHLPLQVRGLVHHLPGRDCTISSRSNSTILKRMKQQFPKGRTSYWVTKRAPNEKNCVRTWSRLTYYDSRRQTPSVKTHRGVAPARALDRCKHPIGRHGQERTQR